MRKNLLYVFCLIAFAGSTSFRLELNEQDLMGSWNMVSSTDTEITFQRGADLVENKRALQFNTYGVLLVQKIDKSFWCDDGGVPYEVYRGTWKLIDDKSLLMKYEDYKGKKRERLKVISLENDILVVKK